MVAGQLDKVSDTQLDRPGVENVQKGLEIRPVDAPRTYDHPVALVGVLENKEIGRDDELDAAHRRPPGSHSVSADRTELVQKLFDEPVDRIRIGVGVGHRRGSRRLPVG